jgi:hypothetical protein
VGQLAGFLASTAELAQDLKALQSALEPALPDLPSLASKGAEMLLLSHFCKEVMERAPTIRRLQGIEDVALPGITSLTDVWRVFEQLGKWLVRMESLTESYQKIKTVAGAQVPDREPMRVGAKQLTQLVAWDTRQESLAAEVAQLSGKLETVVVEEQTVLDEYGELGVCPTCSQVIDGRHRHTGKV